MRRAHGRLGARVDGRGLRALPRSGPTRTTPRRSPQRSEEALARRDELVPAGIDHARRFTWRAAGESFLAGYEEASA